MESRIRESEDSCQVKPHSKPWIVGLTTLAGVGFCGGTLIGIKTVVTAAHCTCIPNTLNCDRWKETEVIIGDHHRTTTDCNKTLENEQCFRIEFGEVYKEWNGNIFCPMFSQLFLYLM